MAEKTVAVRLKLIHDQYIKATREAGKATENVAKADKWKQLGQATASLGDTLTRNVTLPIVGVGVAATKMALDFDSVFVQMQSLAGATADEIDGMKQGVLDLAADTGKAPKELAEALYFLRSSGLDAAQAMDALEMSAKASAAGMGSTVDIADAVSSAMNAYAKSGLTAAEATDVLVATAREGKAEPAELAKQMGRLLPLSSELGITFQDVGAALAALSLSGNDAAGASTLLSNIMSKLLKPSQQAIEAMAGVGISLDDIRSMIAEQGLLGTLETLRASLGDSGFTRFLEDAQAVQGGLALTGENVEANREIFESLNDSVGATEKAFETWAESMGAKNAKAWAQFQAALIRLGDTLAPVATDLIGFASRLLEAFDKLPDPVKKVVAGLVIMAAAAGPLLSVGGRMVSVWASLSKAFANMTTWASGGQAFANAMNQGAGATSNMTSKLGGLKSAAAGASVALSAAVAVFALKSWADDRKRKEIEDMTEAFSKLTDTSDEAALEAFKVAEAFGRTDEIFEGLLESSPGAAERFVELAENAGLGRDKVQDLRDAIEEKIQADAQAQVDAEAHAEAVEEAAGAFDEETTAVNLAVEALGKYADALAAQFDPLFGVMDASKGVRDARLGVEEATRKLAEAEKEHGRDSAEAAEASRELADAHDDAVKAALDFEQAQVALASAVENGDVKLNDAIAMLQRWVEQGHITQAEADETAAKFQFSAASVDNFSTSVRNVPGSTSTDVKVNTLAAREGIRNIHGDLNALDARSATLDVYVTVHGKTPSELLAGYGAVPRSRARLTPRALGGPVWSGEGYLVGERGPEWFEPNANGRIIPNHMLQSNLVSHGALAGGAGTVVNIFNDWSGVMTTSPRQLDALVADSWNRALQTMPGRVNIKMSAVQR